MTKCASPATKIIVEKASQKVKNLFHLRISVRPRVGLGSPAGLLGVPFALVYSAGEALVVGSGCRLAVAWTLLLVSDDLMVRQHARFP